MNFKVLIPYLGFQNVPFVEGAPKKIEIEYQYMITNIN